MSCACASTSSDSPCDQVGRLDLCVVRGTSWSQQFQWEVGDPSAPVDLTGYTARMVLTSAGQTTVELSTANGAITLGGVAGTITPAMTVAQTTALGPVTYDYVLELTAGATVTRLLQGSFATL